MSVIVTKDGVLTTREKIAKECFAQHYEMMRKYHTQFRRVINNTVAKNNKTGVPGVWCNPRTKKYQAYITIQKKKIHLGTFESCEEAAEARDRAVHKYYDPIVKEIEAEFNCKKGEI